MKLGMRLNGAERHKRRGRCRDGLHRFEKKENPNKNQEKSSENLKKSDTKDVHFQRDKRHVLDGMGT